MAKREARPTGRPVIPLGVDNDDQSLVFFQDGRPPRSPVIMFFSDHDIGRMRAGYVCIQCYEDLDTAFPERCPVCGYEMAKRQSEEFAKDYRGNAHIGPSTTLEEEREIMNFLREKEAHEKGYLWKPSILVPRGL